ncbi:hypothetical protein V8C86DRAFT_2967544 [Haematococcus lacustris]
MLRPASTPVPCAKIGQNIKAGFPSGITLRSRHVAHSLEQRFKDAYTMSQVYVADRPAPIPLTEHERRRKQRELEEICGVAKRKGISADTVTAQLAAAEQLLPGLVNLHRAKAADWLAITADTGQLALKLVALKELYPRANMQKVLAAQPRLLLKSSAQLSDDAAAVRRMLSSLGGEGAVDALIEAEPELSNPTNLSRSLNYISTAFAGQDPVQVLARQPDVLRHQGEGSIQDSAEYGEISTKD